MSDNQNIPQEDMDGKKPFNEELEVAGNQLVERVKELIEEGNVRRLIIRNPEGRTLLEIPLTFGAVAGGALLIWLGPVLAALAVIGALVARIKIEIVRTDPDTIQQELIEADHKVKNDLEDE